MSSVSHQCAMSDGYENRLWKSLDDCQIFKEYWSAGAFRLYLGAPQPHPEKFPEKKSGD
jgi:hypothetical protein